MSGAVTGDPASDGNGEWRPETGTVVQGSDGRRRVVEIDTWWEASGGGGFVKTSRERLRLRGGAPVVRDGPHFRTVDTGELLFSVL